MSNPSVFISSSAEGLPVARALSEHLGPFADCTLWRSRAVIPDPTIFESLREAAERSDFAVFVLTPDDVNPARGERFETPMPNLYFELGYLAGRIGISRTIVLSVRDPQGPRILPDDLGFHCIPVEIRTGDPASYAEPVLAHAASLIQSALSGIQPQVANKPIDFCSYFISYSWFDQPFATRLLDDLQSVGVRCWLDPKDIKVADSVLPQIDLSMQVHDKVLLVLSDSSVRSDWVNIEIQNALKLEQERNQTILFPVRLDDAILGATVPGVERVREKHILDFRDWHNDSSYQRAFSRLVRDLAISTSVESGGRD